MIIFLRQRFLTIELTDHIGCNLQKTKIYESVEDRMMSTHYTVDTHSEQYMIKSILDLSEIRPFFFQYHLRHNILCHYFYFISSFFDLKNRSKKKIKFKIKIMKLIHFWG